MKKKILAFLSFSFLLTGLVACGNSDIPSQDEPKDEETLPVLPEAEGSLQKFFDSLRMNNFTVSYSDSYAAQGVERTQMSYYTDYSLQSQGDLGFNGYAQNDEFGKNTRNDELLVSVFLRKTYNPDVLPQEVSLTLVQDTLTIDCVSNYYEEQDAYDRSTASVYNVGSTENKEIKKYLEDGKTSKTPLDRKFYELIAPYLTSNNYKVYLDATGLRNDSGGMETFRQNQYFLDDAIIYETLSSTSGNNVTGFLQTPGAVVNFKLDDMNDDKLEILGTPSNQGDGFYTSLYGEYLTYVLSSMSFSNFIGYVDEEHENSYYITDSQAQSILAYICQYELDTTERSLKSLRLEVNDWETHAFTLYFDVYNPTTSLDRGIFKATFSDVNNVNSVAVERYLNIGDSALTQDKTTLETVLNKFKGNNYSMDVISDAGLSKVYYTENYYFIQTYGVPTSNEGFIKEGNSIYGFNLTYNVSGTQITAINIDRSKDYATGGMKLPGCGEYMGDLNTDLFYFSAFDPVIYDYEEANYTPASIMGYNYWKNNGTVSDGKRSFSKAVFDYFGLTSSSLPQGAGFMVSDGEDPYDVRVSMFLAYSSADGLNFGGQFATFYDVGGTGFDYLDKYVKEHS